MIGKLALASLLPALAFGQYTATYDANNLPATTEEGQAGTNAPSSTTSAYGDSSLGNTEREVVSWCLKSGYGTRLIPTGAITGAHFVKTPTYLQFSGTLAVRNGPSLLNIPQNDAGGELDPHGADGLGNPIGGLVFTSAFGGGLKQIHEWNSFIGAGYFCFKVCDEVEGAPLQCQHIVSLDSSVSF
ncbi:hypothetical protein QFC19_003631 [Naganishia cerealis]|uniref:Uncharacterized protein n=1 Tax=Naganishia cerealis TaxID=610337 RepID=A0ACC2W1B1_9TREE|nr:hypothetical protein QFC19_003631 [Naganishia cerealis]